jgi:hypothetical protein
MKILVVAVVLGLVFVQSSLWAASDDQEDPAVVSNGNGCFVVWADQRHGHDIYGARVSATGELLDPAGIPICTDPGYQSSPQVAFDGQNYLVVWDDDRESTSSFLLHQIYGARVSVDGRVLDTNGFAITTNKVSRLGPAVAFNGSQFFVVWSDWHRTEGAIADVYGSPVSSDGEVANPDGIPLVLGEGWQTIVDIASANGEYLVTTWSNSQLLGLRVASDGSPLSDVFPIEPGAAEGTTYGLASNRRDYFVVWGDAREASHECGCTKVYGTLIRGNGVVQNFGGVPIATGVRYQSNPSVVSVGDEFFVVWMETGELYGANPDIFGARVTAEGVLGSPARIAINRSPGRQANPDVAYGGGNDFLVVWQDARHTVDPFLWGPWDIYGTLVTGDGAVSDSDGFIISALDIPPPRDQDNDGVTDDRDRCPGTPSGIPVDGGGCPLPPTNCAPRVAWERSFGGSDYEYITQLQQTPDGGYILGGQSRSGADGNKTSTNYGLYDIWIVRINAQGRKLWERSFGGSGDDGLSTIALCTDGGFIVGGISDSPPSGNKTSPNYGSFDYWMLRLDASGNRLWERTFGGSERDFLGGMAQTTDGGFTVVGDSRSGISGNKASPNLGYAGSSDLWVLRLDANGQTLWERTFGDNDNDSGGGVQPTSDGGFMITGQTSAGALGLYDGWLLRLDGDGNKLWERTYGGDQHEAFWGLVPTTEGGFFIGGSSTSPPGGNKTSAAFGGPDYWVLRVNATGDVLWQQTFGGNAEEYLTALRLTPDGGIVFGGSSQSPASGNKRTPHSGQRDWWVVRLAADGRELWQRTFGGSHDDEFHDIAPTADGGFILGGNSDSTDGDKRSPDFGGHGDFWIVKLLPESFGDCDQDNDGVTDNRDQCPGTKPGDVVNANGCSIPQLGPCDGPWRNHAEYVRSVTRTATAFYRAGLISRRQREVILWAAIQSDCGKPPKAPQRGTAVRRGELEVQRRK